MMPWHTVWRHDVTLMEWRNFIVFNILGKSWRIPHVGQEMLTLSGTPDITSFGEFIILLLYICIVYYWICQFKDYVYGLMTLICLPGLVWLLCLGLILFDTFCIVEAVTYFCISWRNKSLICNIPILNVQCSKTLEINIIQIETTNCFMLLFKRILISDIILY